MSRSVVASARGRLTALAVANARGRSAAVADGCAGPNQAKAYVRCGMGACQGRFCGLTVTEIIARERKQSPAEVGYFRLRFPVKPLTLGELASMPPTDGATGAAGATGIRT